MSHQDLLSAASARADETSSPQQQLSQANVQALNDSNGFADEDASIAEPAEETPTPTQANNPVKALGSYVNGHVNGGKQEDDAAEPRSIIEEHGREISVEDKERSQRKHLPEQSWR